MKCPSCDWEMVEAEIHSTRAPGLSIWFCSNPRCGHTERR